MNTFPGDVRRLDVGTIPLFDKSIEEEAGGPASRVLRGRSTAIPWSNNRVAQCSGI